ncbi:MAG: glycosyltransferase family 4 protein, partial [Halobacteriaceae archaeon]
RLSVIPNGTNRNRVTDVDEEILASVRQQYGLEKELVILFVGTITPRKRVLDLVRAVARVKKEISSIDFQVIIAGKTDLDPDYVDRVRDEISDNTLSESITLTGFVSNETLYALYNLADLFVLPSEEEGSSIALTEAMASQTPIVATDISGTAQQITDGTHGYLVEPGNVAALASGIERILKRPRERVAMEIALGDRIDAFSWSRITDRTLDLYRELPRGSSHE